LRAIIRQLREADLKTITLTLDEVESMLIEVEAFRNRYDAASRRQKDGARVRKSAPRKITLENMDDNDEPPGS
jgi:hypothetical protein